MRTFVLFVLSSAVLYGAFLGLFWLTQPRMAAGEPTIAKTPITCASIRAGLDRPDVVDVDDVDFILHSAGCDQAPDGTWQPVRASRCARRALWLVQHQHSILDARSKLTHRGCVQYEDGTYGLR
jgi:hypothetical protein